MPRAEDIHVGKRIRQHRLICGFTQANVAERLGLSFQQLQKCETGHNRVSASRMCDLARELSVHPAYFLEGLVSTPADTEVKTQQETELLKHFRMISQDARDALANAAEAAAYPQS